MMNSRWLRAGKRQHEPGYTLVELLVVLAIIALLAGTAPLVMSGATPEANVRSAADALFNALRETRARAIQNGAEAVLEIDNGHRTFVTRPSGPKSQFPAKVRIAIPGKSAGSINFDISFFPDGTASAHSLLVKDEKRTRVVFIHELTGKITIGDSGAAR